MKRTVILAISGLLLISGLTTVNIPSALASPQLFQRGGCDADSASAVLQKFESGVWKDVASASGRARSATCDASGANFGSPFVTADLPVGTQVRWHVFDPSGAWSIFADVQTVQAPSIWQSLSNVPDHKWGVMILMTDGRVLVEDQGTGNGSNNWWILSPDSSGSYITGNWTQAASMPANFQPLYFPAAVLADGKVLVEGAEINSLGQPPKDSNYDSNLGALYDPVANSWTPVNPPNNGNGEWSKIGDTGNVVLANGTFMIGNQDSPVTDQALFNEASMSWKLTGTGYEARNEESGFTLLPNGKVFSADVRVPSSQSAHMYDPATGRWTPTSKAPVSFTFPTPITTGYGGQGISEMGPAVVLPNGLLFVVGATPNTALYNSATDTWQTGPTFPQVDGVQYAGGDNNAVVLNNGNVLLTGTTYPKESGPSHFFIYDGSTIKLLGDSNSSGDAISGGVNASAASPFGGEMLGLPNGQVLWNSQVGNQIFAYTPDTPVSDSSLAPTVTSVAKELAAGQTYILNGTQLSGLTTGSFEGDERQNSTNYPILQITNSSNNTVSYARTFDIASFSIAKGAAGSFKFQIPSNIYNGSSSLRVIASGFSSAPITVNISGGTALPSDAGQTKGSSKSVLSKTIQCVKGKAVKSVSGISPKCPAGYAKK